MKNIFKKMMLLFFSIIMIFGTACNKGESSASDVNGKQTAMGRYVEKTLEYPLENIKGVNKIVKRSDGSLDCYMRLEEDPYNILYNTKDGINWNKMDTLWYDEITKTGYDIRSIAYDKNDNIYALTVGGENWEYKIFKVKADNQVEEINIDWKKSKIEGIGVYITDMQIANNGDLILCQSGNGIMQYSSDGVFKSQYGSSDIGNFTVSCDRIFLIDQESSQVTIYDSNTYGLLKSVTYDNMTYEACLSAGKGGSIYLTDRSGVYRLAEEGSLWEKIIEGGLTTLSIPSQYFSGITEGVDNNFYMNFEDAESNATLIKYEYDENMSSVPGTELVVYALEENKTLRQAAGEFQRKNADIKVNIKIGIDNKSSITKADAIRALNTELLAGKGPDLILLDGMPIKSYISKGVLTDLSDVLKTVKENGENLLDNITKVYEKDSKIFAVPVKFNVPSMWIDEKYSSEIKNLKQLADFAEKHNDKSTIPYSNEEDLMRIFSLTSASYWTDDDGNIKEGEFADFLTQIKRINDADNEFADDGINDEERKNGSNSSGQDMLDAMDSSAAAFSWAYGRSYACYSNLSSYNSVNLPSLAIIKRNGGVVIHLPGQVEGNVFVPVNSIGINAKSTHIDIAKEFVGIMLSASVQNAKIYDGFPVNIKSLEYGAEGNGNENMSIGITNDYKGIEELSGPLPSAEELNKVKELCLSVTTPSIVDEILLEMIINETKGYFTGEKTIEKAVDDVKEKTKLYLSE